jgi:hypothetical protein
VKSKQNKIDEPQPQPSDTDDANMVIGALDSLGVALADHDHQWTEGELAIYEKAVEIVTSLRDDAVGERAERDAETIRRITGKWTTEIVQWVAKDIRSLFPTLTAYDETCLRKQVLYCVTHAVNDFSDHEHNLPPATDDKLEILNAFFPPESAPRGAQGKRVDELTAMTDAICKQPPATDDKPEDYERGYAQGWEDCDREAELSQAAPRGEQWTESTISQMWDEIAAQPNGGGLEAFFIAVADAHNAALADAKLLGYEIRKGEILALRQQLAAERELYNTGLKHREDLEKRLTAERENVRQLKGFREIDHRCAVAQEETIRRLTEQLLQAEEKLKQYESDKS